MAVRILLLALALLAATAQAANPTFEIRAGAVDLGAMGSTTYTGIGARYRFDDTWAAYGDLDFTISNTGASDARFTRVGGGGEIGFGEDDLRVNFRVGLVYTQGEAFGVERTDTSPSYGIDLRFRRMGIGFNQTKFNDETINSTSFSFYF